MDLDRGMLCMETPSVIIMENVAFGSLILTAAFIVKKAK